MQHLRRHRETAHLALLLFTLSAATSGCTPGDDVTAPGPAWSIELSPSAMSFTAMNVGEPVTATVKDNKGKSIPDATVSWRSENPSIADVSGGGRSVQVVAVSPGATNIRATSGGAEATLIVTVAGVRSIRLSPGNQSLRIGETRNYSASVQADAGVSTAVTWSTSNPTVASVNEQGVVTAQGPGTTSITATSVADRRFKASAQIAVAPVRGIALSPTSVSLTIGSSEALSAAVSLPGGSNTAVSWRSVNPAVATVSSQGVVTAVGVGNTSVVATAVADTSLKAMASVSVIPSVRSVSVNPSVSQVYVGETAQLTAEVDGDPGVSSVVIWRSSNPSIASVSTSGVVTGIASGSATITARSAADTTKFANATVSVSSRPVSVEIGQTDFSLAPGSQFALSATVRGNPGIPTGVRWKSSAPSIASVSANGLVTGIAEGTARITATAVADSTKEASVNVFVSGSMVKSWSASRLNGALYEDVISLYVASANEVFAVNIIGDVFRWNGSSWSVSLSGVASGTEFRSIHGTSPTNIIAVGTNGKIFRWNGSVWSPMVSGTTASLNAVYIAGGNDAYAVGQGGVGLHFDGSAWRSLSTGTTRNLNAVWGVNGFALAVGDGGTAVEYFNGAWTSRSTGTTENLRSVAGFSSTEMAVGGDLGTVLRYNGSTWTPVTTYITADLLSAIAMPGQNAIFMAGSFGTVVKLAGGTLSMVEETPYPARLSSISAGPDNTLWTGGQRGLVQKHAASWDVVNLAPDLIDVWVTSPANAWAVGEFGFIYHFDGSNWTRKPSPTRERLNTVWASSSGTAFAGGDGGVMLRWNGSAWLETGFPSDNDVLGIWGSSDNDVYAVTFGGEVVRWNGSFWAMAYGQNQSLYGVFGSASNKVYAVGDAGTILRYDGSNWSPTSVGQSALLTGIWTGTTGQMVSVGLSPSDPTLGVAYLYQGTSWAPSNLTMTPPELTSVWGVRSTDLYATGGNGTILRFNGTNWQSLASGTGEYLWSVSGAPTGDAGAFAVGFNSVILRGANAAGVASGEGGSTAGGAAPASGDFLPVAGGLGGSSSVRSFNPSPLSHPAKVRTIPDGEARKSRARQRS